MKKLLLTLLVLAAPLSCIAPSHTTTPPNEPSGRLDPSQLYGELFRRVQAANVFEDSKYFVDMIPREDPALIMRAFERDAPTTKETLEAFVEQHFSAPKETSTALENQVSLSIDRHIRALWKKLRRSPDEDVQPFSSLIHLPYSYVVPGGRFREIYYWDSYFTLLGLAADRENDLFEDMIKNFEHLLLTMHRIPNGNRSYYRGRSQPPFFSHMVELWQKRFGEKSAARFLPALKLEHDFWMSGPRAVDLNEGDVLNRYWDDSTGPRPEAFKEDVKLADEAAKSLGRAADDLYRDLRAGAESGWDYSTRWFRDPKVFATIQTTAFLPVDLNSLLFHLETKISELSGLAGDSDAAKHYQTLAAKRAELVRRYFWDAKVGGFFDYNWSSKTRSTELTAATVVPLFVGLATPEQARKVARTIERKLLKAGGLVTSLRQSGQQWDAPNGWPPLQWMGFMGLKRYKEIRLANRLRSRWLALNRKVYRDTGKMMEKYNVIDLNMRSGGGEYPLQDGFGWTNGVYRALTEQK